MDIPATAVSVGTAGQLLDDRGKARSYGTGRSGAESSIQTLWKMERGKVAPVKPWT